MHPFGMKTLTALCALALAGGCSSMKETINTAGGIVPVSRVSHGAGVADADYQIGRAYQDRLQYETAIVAYRKSLEANPGNAEAHNALAVIFASQGKHEQAVTQLMAGLALAPSAAHMHNNLGYMYFLQGRNADALAAFRIATGLDPANERARENIKNVQKRLARVAPNANAPSVPSAVAAGANLSPRTADANTDPSMPRLLSVAPNIFELRQGSSMQVTPDLPLPTEIARITVRLEVANGNGVTGLAKRTSSSLKQRGYAVVRLTNQVPYKQWVTEIQYRQGDESGAKQLNALLSERARLVESSRLGPAVGVRLVLGHDIRQRSLFIEDSASMTLARL